MQFLLVAVAPAAGVHGVNNVFKIGLVGTLAAFAGVMGGKRFLHKITMKAVQTLTGILLLGIALALGTGIV
jgi:uncharacterized protein